MAERKNPTPDGDLPENPEAKGAQGEHLNPDGSSGLDSTQDGRFTRDDVANSPFQQGKDPLSDRAIDRRTGRPSIQLIVFAILAVVFGYFFVSDLINGEWLKAVLGAAVLGICAVAITRELRGGRPRD